MRLFMYWVGISLLAGCATANEAAREEREYREVEWRAQLAEDRRDCRSQGGLLVFKTGMARLGRRTVPRPGDTYTCDLSMAYQRR